MTIPLTKRLGLLPVGYTIVPVAAANGVKVNGPAGPAVILEINDGTQCEVMTSFTGDKTRYYWDAKTPGQAMEHVVALNRERLIETGELAAPAGPAEPEAAKVMSNATAGGILAALILVPLALVVGGIWYLASGGDNQEPGTPAPQGPMVQVTIMGPQGKYTEEECLALRIGALTNDNPHASDDLAQYDVHCRTKHIVLSPAPVMETTR